MKARQRRSGPRGGEKQVNAIPSVALGKGPFTHVPPEGNMGMVGDVGDGREVWSAPDDLSPESLAIRAHEYGHLMLDREGWKDQIRGLTKAGISPLWAQAVMDGVVNKSLEYKKVKEYKDLPLKPPVENSLSELKPEHRWAGMQYLIRSEGLNEHEKLRQSLKGELNQIEQKLLDHASDYIRYAASNPKNGAEYVLEVAKRLQEAFGSELPPKPPPKPASSPSSAKGKGKDKGKEPGEKGEGEPEEDPGEFKDLSGQEAVEGEGESETRNEIEPEPEPVEPDEKGLWGKMAIIETPLDITSHLAKRKLKAHRRDWAGSFKYPLHAMVPAFDGKCFATFRRVLGGTILIDLSGSMDIDNEMLAQVLKYAPAATIAGYAGQGPTHDKATPKRDNGLWGELGLLAKDGKLFDAKRRGEFFGNNNLVDGPAMDWLLTQPEPRIWVSDGGVTGAGGGSQVDLMTDIAKKLSKGRVKQILTLKEAVDQLAGYANPK